MSTSIETARALRQGRYTKRITVLSEGESEFVLTSSLSEGEKVVWFYLAHLSKYDENLTIALTHRRLSEKLNKSLDTIGRRIKSLRDKKYLSVQYDPQLQKNIYTVILPEDGINYIDSQPDRRAKKLSQCGTVDTSKLAQTTPLQICGEGGADLRPTPYINNTFKKHNMHDRGVNSVNNSPKSFSCNISQTDGYALLALLEEYTAHLRTQNPNISIRELVSRQNEKFTPDQMELILEAQREKAGLEAQNDIKAPQNGGKATKQQQRTNDQVSSQERLEGCTKLEEYWLDGQVYKLEKSVLMKLLKKLTWFNKTDEFKGEAAKRDRNTLWHEVLYYTASAFKSKYSQDHRLNTALYLMKNGDWEMPYAVVNRQIKQREHDWSKAKSLEIERSKNVMENLGLSH